MPIAFKRRHLDDIASTSSPRYFLSEKTDGERYMLAVCMDKFGRLVADKKDLQDVKNQKAVFKEYCSYFLDLDNSNQYRPQID